METIAEIREAFRANLDEDLWIRIAEESDRNGYRTMLQGTGHRGENFEFETEWKTAGNLDHILERNGGFDFGIFYDGELVGTIRFKADQKSWNARTANIGYELVPEYRGRGFVTRCLRECVNIVYRNLDFDRLIADGDVQNKKSESVAKRLGFRYEGVKHFVPEKLGKPVEFWIYSMNRSDWTAKESNEDSNHARQATP